MVWGWGYLALSNIKGFPLASAALLPLLVSLPLLFFTVRFSNHLRGLAGPKLFRNKRSIWLYITGLVVTVGGYILAIVVARMLHHPEYVIPIATLIVGLHFLFIVLAFDANRAYFTVAVFCLAALLVPLTVPLRITIGSIATINKEGSGWMEVIAIIGMLWLTFMALYLLVTSGRRLREVRDTNQQFVGTGQANEDREGSVRVVEGNG
jgi:D-alanyl-lipoteichoic acid acyltransferase DltB (MBOAT superfamily)